MSQFREWSTRKSVVMPIFMVMVFFLIGPQVSGLGQERKAEQKKIGANAGPAVDSTPDENGAVPGSIERGSSGPVKKKSPKTIWIVASLVVVAGVAAYFLLASGAKGSIDVKSTPAGAAIYVDDQDTGKTTPALLTKIKTGTRKLTLKKAGSQDCTVSVTVEKNKTAQVDAELLAAAMTEDFQDNVADHWLNNGLGTWDIANWVYRFRGGAAGTGYPAYSWYDLGNYEDFTLQASIRNGGDQGLAYRGNPATGEWYVFYAWGTQWAVFRYTATTLEYVVRYTESAALHRYPLWNEFKVVAKGANFGFYINGTLVGSAYDTHFPRGKIGFQVRDCVNVTMEMDNVSVSLSTDTSSLPGSVRGILFRKN